MYTIGAETFKPSTMHLVVCLVRLASEEMMEVGVNPHWERRRAAEFA